jgi:hypothetical protein
LPKLIHWPSNRRRNCHQPHTLRLRMRQRPRTQLQTSASRRKSPVPTLGCPTSTKTGSPRFRRYRTQYLQPLKTNPHDGASQRSRPSEKEHTLNPKQRIAEKRCVDLPHSALFGSVTFFVGFVGFWLILPSKSWTANPVTEHKSNTRTALSPGVTCRRTTANSKTREATTSNAE